MRRLQQFVWGHQLRFAVKALIVSAALLLPVVAHAQSHRFNIPAQNLDSALKEFGLQADRQVLFSAELVAGRRSNAVIGSYDAARALEILLAGRGLTYEATASNALLIKGESKQGGLPSNDGPVPAGKRRAATEIEEITVTAQKREESIQETPISVTALTGETLQAKGMSSVLDLAATVPSLRISESPGSSSTTTVSIRGLAQGNLDPALSPKVGLYVDGAYIAQLKGSNFDLEDLERVEVLRGPQGTLYGRNTIGGAVNFITKKPTEERSVTLKTEVGNFEAFNGRLTVNVPLVGKNGYVQSDALGTLSLRETAGYKTHDGYYQNALPPNVAPNPNAPLGGGADYNNLNRVYNFTGLRWQPSKDITVDYGFEYHRYRDHESAFQLTYIYPGSTVSIPKFGSNPNPFYMAPYIQKNRSDVVPTNAPLMSDKRPHQNRDDGNHRMHTLTGTWDLGEIGPLGGVVLKSISTYRSFVAQTDTDIDGTPLSIYNGANILDTQTWSEELQWAGTAPRFHYVLGAYYFGEYDSYRNQSEIFGGAVILPYRNFRKDKAYAPYGQATWTPPILGDKLSVTAGLRYTQEQIHLDHFYGKVVQMNSTAPSVTNSGGKAFGGSDALSPMGDISYQWTNDLMTYFRVSRGYSSGGFNDTSGSAELFRSFKPETLWAFEGGVKSQWLDNRLRMNATGFFSYYENLQVPVGYFSPTAGLTTIASNADRAEIWGMEFEGTAIPFRGLEATVSYSFFAPKYTKWLDLKVDAANQPIFDPAGHLVLESVADKRSFPYAPQHQVTAGLTYTALPTSTGIFSGHLDVSWQDRVTFISNNYTAGGQADEGWAYALVGGRLAYTGIPLQKGSLDLAVFARNLLDRKYRTFGIDFGSGLGFAGNSYGDPRTFGLQLIYNFSES